MEKEKEDWLYVSFKLGPKVGQTNRMCVIYNKIEDICEQRENVKYIWMMN